MSPSLRNVAAILFILHFSPACGSMVSGDWANTLGGMLLRSCMYGFGISHLASEFDKSTDDRLWKLDCRQVGFRGGDKCYWTSKGMCIILNC